jgi:hypothetical protein
VQVNNLQTIELDESTFAHLHKNGKVISEHRDYGPKVFITEDGDYIKVFNPKSGLTKRKIFPKYKKFIENAYRLRELNIKTINITGIYHLTQFNSYAVKYQAIAGEDLRSLFASRGKQLVKDFLPFLYSLHEKGIYFRGIHLGNVLLLDNKDYGLIDVADLYFRAKPLSIIDRVRNLAHMVKTKPDDDFFAQYSVAKFIQEYAETAKYKGLKLVIFKLFCKLYRLGE